ncbi:Dps family protein [Algiphilus sp.]|uniref:Dps family protein n=1 Tax=Algiphilus sp. TaxID=1872431 RepID=UPI003B515D27
MDIDIGISEDKRVAIAQGLCRLLADEYTLYLKTHNFHWNVTGPMFTTLHQMFEEHYTEAATAVDDVAERIRTLGERAPGSYQEFSALATVKEETQQIEATEMVRQLVKDHETVAKVARDVFKAADEAADESSADLLTQRMQLHEKTAWMLRSLLD